MNLLRKFHLHSKVLCVMTLRYARFMLLFYPKRQLEFGIISLSFIFFRKKLIGTNPMPMDFPARGLQRAGLIINVSVLDSLISIVMA